MLLRSYRSRRLGQLQPHDSCGGRSTEAGFTLVEVLVAITLLALLMALLAGGLRLGARVWEREGIQGAQAAEMQIIHDFLRRLLQQTYPSQASGKTHLVFDGKGNALSFVAPLPSHVGYGGFYNVKIFIKSGPTNRQLVLRYILRHPDIIPSTVSGAVSGETVLLNDIEDLEIRYFGPTLDSGPQTWHAEWLNKNRLPDLIQLNVRFPYADTRIWPSLITAPMIGIQSLCVREPNDSRCRHALPGR